MCQKCAPVAGDYVFFALLQDDEICVAKTFILQVRRDRGVVRVDTQMPGWPPGRRYVAIRHIAHDEHAAKHALIERLTTATIEAQRRLGVASAKMDELNARGGVSNV